MRFSGYQLLPRRNEKEEKNVILKIWRIWLANSYTHSNHEWGPIGKCDGEDTQYMRTKEKQTINPFTNRIVFVYSNIRNVYLTRVYYSELRSTNNERTITACE